jgi:hypothetical protein
MQMAWWHRVCLHFRVEQITPSLLHMEWCHCFALKDVLLQYPSAREMQTTDLQLVYNKHVIDQSDDYIKTIWAEIGFDLSH